MYRISVVFRAVRGRKDRHTRQRTYSVVLFCVPTPANKSELALRTRSFFDPSIMRSVPFAIMTLYDTLLIVRVALFSSSIYEILL